MKTYKVKSLHVGGLGNKIFKFGQSVTERNFPAGNAEKLAAQGFLEETGEVDDPAPVKPTQNALKEGAVKFEAAIKLAHEMCVAGDFNAAKVAINEALVINPDSDVAQKALADIEEKLIEKHNAENGGGSAAADDNTVRAYDEINEDELKRILKDRKVEFNENSKKKYLYKLYTESAGK